MSTILTDDEIATLMPNDDTPMSLGEAFYTQARAVEAAVLAKLAQQQPVASVRTWHKNGDQHAELDDWGLGLASIPDGTHNLYTHPAPQQADRQRVPDECKVVPVKPTQDMMDAAMAYVYKHGFTRGAGPGAVYAAMLAAAPEAPAQADRQRVPDEQEVRLLLNRFERQVHRMGELWERCQGKGWPASESDEFAILRDAKTPKTRAALIALLAAAPEASAQASSYLEEVYEYLCSSAPVGFADEAFRLVPSEVLSFETRNRISLQRKPKGALPREISRHDGPLTRGRAGDGGSVAAPEAPAQAEQTKCVPCPTCGANTASPNPLNWCACPKQPAQASAVDERQPLTDEQIVNMANPTQHLPDAPEGLVRFGFSRRHLVGFARSIERAHGIGGEGKR